MPEWSLLSMLDAEETRLLLKSARRRTHSRGEVVFHRDDPADTVHLVSSGTFAVRVITPVGDTVTLGIVGPGNWFGELALVRDRHVRSATVSALSQAETYVVGVTEFERLRHECPQLDRVLVEYFAHRVAELSELLVDALYTPAPERVRKLLGELARRYADPATGTAVIPLTQEDVAGLAGTSRLTVSRVLRELRAEGSVQVGRGRIVIT
jgi:CRP/FNR family transcriptional regulator, cyclic AMP receptor protein